MILAIAVQMCGFASCIFLCKFDVRGPDYCNYRRSVTERAKRGLLPVLFFSSSEAWLVW
jgi:hypothetical protein